MKNENVHFQSASVEWATPIDFFKLMESKFGAFDLDCCASEESKKCDVYFSQSDNGLIKPWHGRVWMNPPYGRGENGISAWIKKAHRESLFGVEVVCLIPARTDTAWWHDYVIPHAKSVEFIRGRIKFIPFGDNKSSGNNTASFPSAVVLFSNK